MALSSYSQFSASSIFSNDGGFERVKEFFSQLNPLYLKQAPQKVYNAHHFLCGDPKQAIQDQSFALSFAKGEIGELSACLDFLFQHPHPLNPSEKRQLIKALFALWFSKDSQGNTPLHLALDNRQRVPLSCLFSYPLMPSLYHQLFQANSEGKSLLYLAAGNKPLFENLVELSLPLDLKLQLLMASPSLLLHPKLALSNLRPLVREIPDDSLKQLREYLPLPSFQVLLYLIDKSQAEKVFPDQLKVRGCLEAKVRLVNFLKESLRLENMLSLYENNEFLWEVSLVREQLKQNSRLSEEGKRRLGLSPLEIMSA